MLRPQGKKGWGPVSSLPYLEMGKGQGYKAQADHRAAEDVTEKTRASFPLSLPDCSKRIRLGTLLPP